MPKGGVNRTAEHAQNATNPLARGDAPRLGSFEADGIMCGSQGGFVTQLRQKVLDELHFRNYSTETIWMYISAVREFVGYIGRLPERVGPEEIRRYQKYLRRERVSA